MDMHNKLVSALIQYDEKESRKKHHNRHFIGIALGALETAEEDIAAGVTVRTALVNNFCGRLLDILLKTVGETPSTDLEQRI